MDRITIIGNGNVGSHLYKALKNVGAEVDIVGARGLEDLPAESQIMIIATKDSYIEETAVKIKKILPDFQGIVAHCAGSVGMNVLSPYFRHYGVIYPMQTFSKDISIDDYGTIPFFLEGNTMGVTKALKTVAESLSSKVAVLDSERRMALHIASVFSCNFVNAIYNMAADILENEGMSFEILHPLISQTCAKVLHNHPQLCQTGPALRGDTEIMNKHMQKLEQYPIHKELYKQISDYIHLKTERNHE